MVNPWPVIARSVTLQGIYVGSRELFEDMTRALSQSAIRPIIDRVFEFDDAPAAFEHMAGRAHFGKIVIRV
jgi:NADPH:quinone reductase-like Zn-dependent oxidoreductase